MKKAFHRRWRVAWHDIGEYTFLGKGNYNLREHILFALERVQEFFTRLPQADQRKKRGRLLRRMLPSLFCLLLGFVLFAPVHAQSTSPAQAHTTTVTKQRASAKTATDDCSDSSTNYDALSGLPVPDPNGNGNTPCTVPIRSDCRLTSPITSASGGSDWFFGGSTQNSSGFDGTGNLTNSGLLFVTYFVSQPLWNIVLGIALSLLAGPVILAGYQIMLGTASTRYAGAIATLSRVLLVALLAVMSYTLISAFFNLESALVLSLNANTDFATNLDTTVVVPASDWCMHVQNFFGNLYNLNVDQLLNAQQTLTGSNYASAVYTSTLNLVTELPDVLKTLLSILLAAQLLTRSALLWLYWTVSPLAIVSGSLPGESGKNAAWAWVRGFTALIFVQLLQLLVLGIGGKLIPASLATGSDWFNTAVSTLLPVIIVTVTLNIPRLLNASTTTMLSTVSGSIGGAMTNVILIVRGF
jgi:hypothetical protein